MCGTSWCPMNIWTPTGQHLMRFAGTKWPWPFRLRAFLPGQALPAYASLDHHQKSALGWPSQPAWWVCQLIRDVIYCLKHLTRWPSLWSGCLGHNPMYIFTRGKCGCNHLAFVCKDLGTNAYLIHQNRGTLPPAGNTWPAIWTSGLQHPWILPQFLIEPFGAWPASCKMGDSAILCAFRALIPHRVTRKVIWQT